jgi:hypothetical protein
MSEADEGQLHRFVGREWIERTTGKSAVVMKEHTDCVTWRYRRCRNSWLTTSRQFVSRFYTPNKEIWRKPREGEK